MTDSQVLIASIDLATDRIEFAVIGWGRGALRGQSPCLVLLDEIDAYPFAAVPAPMTPAAHTTPATRSDARPGRRAARRQSGRARGARLAAASYP